MAPDRCETLVRRSLFVSDRSPRIDIPPISPTMTRTTRISTRVNPRSRARVLVIVRVMTSLDLPRPDVVGGAVGLVRAPRHDVDALGVLRPGAAEHVGGAPRILGVVLRQLALRDQLLDALRAAGA